MFCARADSESNVNEIVNNMIKIKPVKRILFIEFFCFLFNLKELPNISDEIKNNINLYDYLKESKPPIAGEPIITAKVTRIPKGVMTIPTRLFFDDM